MAGQADGRIIVITELDPKGFEAGSKDLRRAVQSLVSKVNSLEPTVKKAAKGSADALQTFDAKATGLETTITELKDKLYSLGHTGIPTDEYQKILENLEKVNGELSKLKQKRQEMRDLGVKEGSTQWRRLQYNIEKAQTDYEALKKAKQEAEETNTAFKLGMNDTTYQKLKADIDAATASLQRMREQTEGGASGGGRLASMGARVKNSLSGAVSKARQLVSTLAKATMSRLISGAKRLGATLKSLVGTTKQLILGNRDYDKSFKKLTKSAKKIAFGLLGVKSIWMILKKAVSSYLAANEELANTQKQIWASLGSFLGPAIEAVIGFVAKAISYLSAFLHLLGFTSKAATSAINSSGKAAEKETKKLERQLASFDELNILSANKSDKSDKDTGDPPVTPLADAKLPDWAKEMGELLKQGKWEEAALILADQLNQLVDSVDWAGLGDKVAYYFDGVLRFLTTAIKAFNWENLGSKLATFLNHLLDGVDWGNLGFLMVAGLYILLRTLTGFFETLDPKIVSKAIYDFIMGGVNGADWPGLTGRFAKALNDFFLGIDFRSIGTALGTAIQTVIASIHAALDAFDWLAIGAKLADFLNGILYAVNWGELGTVLSGLIGALLLTAAGFALNLDWAKLAQSFSDFAIGFFNGITDAFTQVDWQQIGHNVATFLENVKWGEVFDALCRAIGAVLGGLAAFLWGLISDAWESVKNWWRDVAFEDGQFTMSGLLEGILEALKNLGNWIKENIFQPFIDGFKKAFGIASPSKEMKKQGQYVIDGLKAGIKAAWNDVKKLVSDKAQEILNAFKNKYESLKTAGSNLMSKLKSGFSEKWSSAKNNFSTIATNLKNTFANLDLHTVGSNLMTGLHNGLVGAWNRLQNGFSSVASSITGLFQNAFQTHSPSRVFTLIGGFLMQGLSNGMEAEKKNVLATSAGIASAVTNEMGAGEFSLSSTIPRALDTFSETIADKFSALMDRLDTIANRVTFTTPALASGATPYRVASAVGGVGAGNTYAGRNDDLASVVIQSVTNATAAIVRAIEDNGGTTVNLDAASLTTTVINEINRRTRVSGKSPLLI